MWGGRMFPTVVERVRTLRRMTTPYYRRSDVDLVTERVRATCHDLRQPIATVLALTAAALAAPELPDQTRANLRQIGQQAEWLADIVRDGLAVDQAVPRAVPAGALDLGGLLEESAREERATYAGDLDVRTAAGPAYVRGDRVGLRRALANVLANATRAAGPFGHVQVDLRRAGGRAVLVVDDDGPGFGRIPAGHGLGLRIAARSLRACGGRVEFGRAPAGGTRVLLSLPLLGGERHGESADAARSL